VIEPTAEMIALFDGLPDVDVYTGDTVPAILRDLLAIVERELQPPPRRVLDEINAVRQGPIAPRVDQRLRAALWTCSTYSIGDLDEALRAAGFVHRDGLPSPHTGSKSRRDA